jgi:hypothetical protein
MVQKKEEMKEGSHFGEDTISQSQRRGTKNEGNKPGICILNHRCPPISDI